MLDSPILPASASASQYKTQICLAQVDQPGSLIDTYVEKLEVIIQEKSKGIKDLQLLLNSFKGRLQQEEVFSKSMGKSKRKGVLK